MDLLTEPVIKLPRPASDTHTVTQWLDALATGACDQDTFLHGVGDILQRAPDAGWELLALLDQYYRRGKISAEAFGNLKTHLQGLLMGKGRGGEVSAPVSQTHDEQPLVTTAMPRGDAPASSAFGGAARTAAMWPDPISEPIAAARPSAGAAPDPASPSRSASMPFAGRARIAVSEPFGASTPGNWDREPADTVRPGPERTLAVGDVLRGRYRVQGLLGQGGMGTVFEAIDQYRLDRSNGDQKVAIKVLHTAVIQRPRLFAELRREFQHLQALSHPNIVRVHEFDRDGDIAFFTMEYLSGALLSRVLSAHESSPLYRPYALAIIRDVGAAVAHAHARGVVHGDLNPGNIFITDNGEVRVLDFGAAHQLRRSPWISEFEDSLQIAVATTGYASCQLLEGEAADVRDDVYALACISYVLLTGNHPFGEHSALKARTLRLTPIRPGALDRRQWNALRAGLHFERERRPSDMQAWLNRLNFRAAVAHLPVLSTLSMARPRRQNGARWVTVLGTLALIMGCVWWATTHVDTLAGASTAAGAKLRSSLANTVISQLWDNRHESVAAEQPNEGADNPAPIVEETPEPPVTQQSPSARPQSQPAMQQSPPAKAMIATRNAARGAAQVTTPNVSAVPSTASAAVGGAPGSSGYPVHARIELAADNIDVAPTEPIAHVVVRRSRTLRGDVSFSWWTESGTAKPGRDFVPVKSHVEHIEDGKNAADLTIPILADPSRRDSRSFYVVIDEASDNAALGARTLSMVTIPGTD
jgi:serine/threonine protein kinase